MRASIFSIKRANQNDIDYLNVDLTEGLSGDSFSFRLKEGLALSEDLLDNFEASYIAWQSLSSDTRMPWSPALIGEFKSQVDKFNNYQNYIADIHISDIISPDPRAFKLSTTILEAAQAIIDLKISGAPVVDEDNNLIGIISEKDILSSLFDETSSGNKKISKTGALEMKNMTSSIEDIMITNVLSVNTSDEITPALRIMQNNNLRRLPVVEGTKLIGMIGIGDIHRAIFKSCMK